VGTPRKNITTVRVDYRKGMKKIVEYLYSLGHLRMAFVGITLRWDRSTSAGRLSWTPWRNVRRAPKHALLPERTDWKADARRLASCLVRASIDAIICVNDFMAVGVLRELREQGIRVPQEISVTGFDNIRLAEFCSPALTTAHIPREKIGQIIFESLVPIQRRSS